MSPDRQVLEVRQLAAVRALLSALPSNRFYAPILEQAQVDGSIASLQEFFDRMPLLRKQSLIDDQVAHSPYGSNLTYPLERYARLCHTSGTAGAPLYWLDTPESWEWMLDTWERIYRSAGITPSDRIFFAFSFGMFLGFWTAFDAAERLGCLRMPGGGMSSDARLRAILRTGATVLCCTPTYALRLAEVAAAENIDLTQSRIRKIIVAGEPGGSVPRVRARIESCWPGAAVVDHYGMTEIGPVTYECPARPGVQHVLESAFIPEVIDPASGHRLPSGMRGELVLTNLGRIGSPLLRYRTGDLVEPAPESRCECGTLDLALPGGILGRTDDMLVIRGVNIYPAAVEEVMRGFAEVAEYRVQVDESRSLAQLRIQLESDPSCADTARLAARVQAELRSVFGLKVEVSAVPSGELPRFEMKAHRWVRTPTAS